MNKKVKLTLAILLLLVALISLNKALDQANMLWLFVSLLGGTFAICLFFWPAPKNK